MWDVLTRNRSACSRFRAALEDSGEMAEARDLAEVLSALPPALRDHAATCSGCQFAANTFLASRALLRAIPARTDSPDSSFASRVMAIIAARENQLRRRLDAWTSVPKFAAKLTWATAAALLLAGTLLYEQPKYASPASAANVSAPEYLFETPAAPATNDDVLVALLEN